MCNAINYYQPIHTTKNQVHRDVLEQFFYGERCDSFPKPSPEELAIYEFAKDTHYLDRVTVGVTRQDTPNTIRLLAHVCFPDDLLQAYRTYEYQHSIEYQTKRKEAILRELYLYGTLNNTYFKSVRTNKINPIKNYIESLIKKLGINPNSDIVDDCYQEAFLQLQKKPAWRICDIYDENPNKLIATTLCIIQNKCFAVDPRYGNPKHSLVQSILFASTVGGSIEIDMTDSFDQDDAMTRESGADVQQGHLGQMLIEVPDEEEGFTKRYGFTIEEIIDKLNPQQKALFYGMIGAQPRGKVSAFKQAERDELTRVLIKLKEGLSNG